MAFLFIFLAAYGTLNGVAAFAIYRALPGAWYWRAAPVLPIFLLFCLPLLLSGNRELPAWLMLTMFTWMIWVFWFASVVSVGQLWNWTLAPLLAKLATPARAWRLSPAFLAGGGLALVLLGSLWGYWEGGRVRLRTVVVPCPSLPADLAPVRLAQITDLHAGYSLQSRAFERMMEILASAQPELIVSTGDLLDPPAERLPEWLDRLARLDPPLGKYAVFGNHEFYVHPEMATALTHQAGFEILRNRAVFPTPWLRLVGIDDPAGWRRGDHPRPDEAALLAANADQAPFTILLKHQPIVAPAARQHVDLQLSGHTHRGQVFPFGFFVRLVYPHPHGRLLALGDRLRLYVSPGTGTWGTPLRLFARPEVTLLTLLPAKPPATSPP